MFQFFVNGQLMNEGKNGFGIVFCGFWMWKDIWIYGLRFRIYDFLISDLKIKFLQTGTKIQSRK
ncbi:hypothetical protein DYB40_13945 [Enterococcus faecalis]|nr:hypothetical protein DYB40_13945 [Enterococcus faecalis]